MFSKHEYFSMITVTEFQYICAFDISRIRAHRVRGLNGHEGLPLPQIHQIWPSKRLITRLITCACIRKRVLFSLARFTSSVLRYRCKGENILIGWNSFALPQTEKWFFPQHTITLQSVQEQNTVCKNIRTGKAHWKLHL